MARPQTYTDEQLADALHGSGGVVSHAAEALGMSRQWLAKRIRGNTALVEARDEGKNEVLDNAESALFAAVRKGKPWAIRFVLSRLGRDRGYGASLHVDAGITGRVVVMLPDDGRESFTESDGDQKDGEVKTDVA